MNEQLVRSILRLVGVVTIFIGSIMAATSLIGCAGMSQAMHASGNVQVEVSGAMGAMGMTGFFGSAAVALGGFVLYRMAPSLAKRIVE